MCFETGPDRGGEERSCRLPSTRRLEESRLRRGMRATRACDRHRRSCSGKRHRERFQFRPGEREA
eukprot:1830822-Pyramimonas_sp.AAC.1